MNGETLRQDLKAGLKPGSYTRYLHTPPTLAAYTSEDGHDVSCPY